MRSVLQQALKEMVSEMGLFELKPKQTEAILAVLAAETPLYLCLLDMASL